MPSSSESACWRTTSSWVSNAWPVPPHGRRRRSRRCAGGWCRWLGGSASCRASGVTGGARCRHAGLLAEHPLPVLGTEWDHLTRSGRGAYGGVREVRGAVCLHGLPRDGTSPTGAGVQGCRTPDPRNQRIAAAPSDRCDANELCGIPIAGFGPHRHMGHTVILTVLIRQC